MVSVMHAVEEFFDKYRSWFLNEHNVSLIPQIYEDWDDDYAIFLVDSGLAQPEFTANEVAEMLREFIKDPTIVISVYTETDEIEVYREI